MSNDPKQSQTTEDSCPHCGQPMPTRQSALSKGALDALNFMRRECPRRGGYMFEGARPAYEAGAYHDEELAELLAAGAIGPHPDPKKGWIVKW